MPNAFPFADTAARHATCTPASLFLAVIACAAPAHADYGFDPGYNANYLLDAFASINGPARREGRKLVTLPDGDIVVAGRMRFSNDTVQPFWNIGLVRYNRAGVRELWTGPAGPYFWNNFEYVTYPNVANGGSGDVRIESVDDVAYADGKIYVLATRSFPSATVDRDVAVFVFNEDGTLRQNLTVIGSSVDEIGKAIDVKVTNLIAKPVVVTVLAERNFQRAVVAKLNEGSDGQLSLDAGFNGGVPLALTIPLSCPGFAQCNVIPVDLARPARTFGSDAMPIYFTGAIQRAATDWDYLVLKISATGTLETSFGLGGARIVAFDQPGSALGDYPSALWVDSDTGPGGSVDSLIIAGNVSRSCKSGIGIVRLEDDGDDQPGFGVDGRAVYGGSSETGSICEQDADHFANDITRQGNEIAVAGSTDHVDQGGTTLTDGALLRVDATTGAQRSLTALPQQFAGDRSGNSRLLGIRNAGGNRYSVSGDGNSVPFGLLTLYTSARVWPSDTIFANGLEP